MTVVRRMVAGASRGRLAGWVVLAGLLSGCVFSTGRPPADVVAARDGAGRAVVLVRLTTRIDGRELPSMPAILPMDSIWLGKNGRKLISPVPATKLATQTDQKVRC